MKALVLTIQKLYPRLRFLADDRKTEGQIGQKKAKRIDEIVFRQIFHSQCDHGDEEKNYQLYFLSFNNVFLNNKTILIYVF
jgi:hypothetical protein